jgi:hypothetical protein
MGRSQQKDKMFHRSVLRVDLIRALEADFGTVEVETKATVKGDHGDASELKPDCVATKKHLAA